MATSKPLIRTETRRHSFSSLNRPEKAAEQLKSWEKKWVDWGHCKIFKWVRTEHLAKATSLGDQRKWIKPCLESSGQTLQSDLEIKKEEDALTFLALASEKTKGSLISFPSEVDSCNNSFPLSSFSPLTWTEAIDSATETPVEIMANDNNTKETTTTPQHANENMNFSSSRIVAQPASQQGSPTTSIIPPVNESESTSSPENSFLLEKTQVDFIERMDDTCSLRDNSESPTVGQWNSVLEAECETPRKLFKISTNPE